MQTFSSDDQESSTRSMVKSSSMPKINDVKLMLKQKEIKVTQRSKFLLKDDASFKIVSNANDYYERRETAYPFEGVKTARVKEPMPKLLMPMLQHTDKSHLNYNSVRESSFTNQKITELISNKKVVINQSLNKTNSFKILNNQKQAISSINHDISYLKDQTGSQIISQLNSSNLKGKINKEAIKPLASNLPTNYTEINNFINQHALAKNTGKLEEVESKDIIQMISQIEKAVEYKHSIKDEDQDQVEFASLNLNFIQDVLPKDYSKKLIAQYNNALENKVTGDLFQELFRKHNLEHLLKSDNLIFQTLQQDKALHDARISIKPTSLGQPVRRKDAVILLKWLDNIMSKLSDFSVFKNESQDNTDHDLKIPQDLEHDRLDVVQSVLNIGWKELIRQVSVQCIERGFALLKIFNAYMILIEGMKIKYVEMKKSFKLKYRQKIQRVMSSYQSKRNEASDEISKNNREMQSIRNHYEELKVNDEYLKKQLQEARDQLEFQRIAGEELKDINRKLFRENKESRMEIAILKKNMMAQLKDGVDSETEDAHKKEGNVKKAKKLQNLESLEQMRLQQSDDDSSLISLDNYGTDEDESKSKGPDQLMMQPTKFNRYDVEVMDQETQIDAEDSKILQQQQLPQLAQDEPSNTSFSLGKHENFNKQNYEIKEVFKIFGHGRSSRDTIQITDQSQEGIYGEIIENYDDENEFHIDLEPIQQNKKLKKVRTKEEQDSINRSEINSAINKFNNPSLDDTIQTMRNILQENILIEENSYSAMERRKKASLILEQQQQQHEQQQQEQNFSKSYNKYQNFKQKLPQKKISNPQVIEELSKGELEALHELLAQNINNGNEQRAEKHLQIQTKVKDLLNIANEQQQQLIPFQSQNAPNFLKANQQIRESQIDEVSVDRNNFSDEEIYQYNEQNTLMYQDLMQTNMDANQLSFFSQQEDVNPITIQQQDSVENATQQFNIQVNGSKKRKTVGGQTLNFTKSLSKTDSKRYLSNIHLVDGDQLDLNSIQSINFNTQEDWHSKRKSRHKSFYKRVVADRYKFNKQDNAVTTEFDEFHFNQKKQSTNKKIHPSFFLYLKSKNKKLQSIRNIIPKKMINKAISQVYEQILDNYLLQTQLGEAYTIERLYEFVYDICIKKYGLKHVAEKKYSQLLNSIRKYSDTSFKISLFAKFLGLQSEASSSSEEPNFNYLGEDLMFYIQILNFMTNLNLGNKIENLDTNDSQFFAFVKVNESLRFVFEGKLSFDAIAILRKELDTMKQIDNKFNNRLGLIDFDQMMIYFTYKRKELILCYSNETLKSIYSLLIIEGLRSEEGINYSQFNILLKAFDNVQKKKVQEIFFTFCNGKQLIDFQQFQKLCKARGLLSSSSYLKLITQKIGMTYIDNELILIKKRLLMSDTLSQFEDLLLKAEEMAENLKQHRSTHSIKTLKLLLLILRAESKRLFVKQSLRYYINSDLRSFLQIKKERQHPTHKNNSSMGRNTNQSEYGNEE